MNLETYTGQGAARVVRLVLHFRHSGVVDALDGPRVAELRRVGRLLAGHHRVVVRRVAVEVAAEPEDLTLHRLRRVYVHAVLAVVKQVQF